MRIILWAGIFLLACSNDTFNSGDASTNDGGSLDGASPDSLPPQDAEQDALDTSAFANDVVLWFAASDAVVSGTDLVTSWPPHNGANLTTSILTNNNTAVCTNGIRQTKSSVNGHESVTFCKSVMTVKDDSTIRLGSAPFLIEAVMRTPTAASSGLLITKAAEQGAAFPFSSLAFWAKDPNGFVDGELSATDNVTGTGAGLTFQIVGFLRVGTGMSIRVNGQPVTAVSLPGTDDVSSIGNDYQIGGSVFDTGDYRNVFDGDLAEIIVLRNGSLAQATLVEIYLKAKYAL